MYNFSDHSPSILQILKAMRARNMKSPAPRKEIPTSSSPRDAPAI